jgi:hypothetical protein
MKRKGPPTHADTLAQLRARLAEDEQKLLTEQHPVQRVSLETTIDYYRRQIQRYEQFEEARNAHIH